MGRVLMTIVDDTSARHDCLCGSTTRATATARYGDVRRQRRPAERARPAGARGRQARPRRAATSGRASTCSSRRRRRRPTARCTSTARCGPGTYVELRAELDVLVTLANTPHPLDERADVRDHPGGAVRGVDCAAEADATDPLRRPRPSGGEPSRTPTAFLAGVASSDRRPRRGRSSARAPWSHVVRRRRDAADHRPRRQPGRRLPALQRRRPRRALLGGGHRSSPSATSSSSPARTLMSERGRADDDDHGDDVRLPRHDRRGVQPRVEHAALRPPHRVTSTPASTTSSTRGCATG